jgi:hypothetical protein
LLARQKIDASLFIYRKNRSHYSRKTYNISQEIVLFHGPCQEKPVRIPKKFTVRKFFPDLDSYPIPYLTNSTLRRLSELVISGGICLPQ